MHGCVIISSFLINILGNAYVKHEQFYPSVVYITKSNPSMAIIYIQVSNHSGLMLLSILLQSSV